MLSRRLIRRGYDVLLATDGAQAVDVARADAPDIILMDMPVVVLTTADERGLAETLGAAAYLAKPVRADELIAALRGAQQPAAESTTT